MSLTIGKLASSANVNVETIRYYQRVGLLDEPSKPSTGYRKYPLTYIARLHFIKRAQRLGFTLKEIAELLSLGDGRCEDVRTLAEQKRDRIDAQLEDLNAMRKILGRLIETCLKENAAQHCSLIDALSDQSDPPASI